MDRDELSKEWRHMATVVRAAGLILDGATPPDEDALERWMEALECEEANLASLRRRTVCFLRKERRRLAAGADAGGV